MALTFGSHKLIDAADMSSSFHSDAISLVQKLGFSIHFIFTGAPVGSSYIAVSNDNVNWILLPDSTQAISAAGDVFYSVNDSKYLFARLHYSAISGSGSAEAFYSTKEAI